MYTAWTCFRFSTLCFLFTTDHDFRGGRDKQKSDTLHPTLRRPHGRCNLGEIRSLERKNPNPHQLLDKGLHCTTFNPVLHLLVNYVDLEAPFVGLVLLFGGCFEFCSRSARIILDVVHTHDIFLSFLTRLDSTLPPCFPVILRMMDGGMSTLLWIFKTVFGKSWGRRWGWVSVMRRRMKWKSCRWTCTIIAII